MPIKIRCPKCDAVVRVSRSQLGQRVECEECEKRFIAEEPDDEPKPRSTKARRESEDEPDDLPRRKVKKRPRKRKSSAGNAVMKFAVIGLSILFLGGAFVGIYMAFGDSMLGGNSDKKKQDELTKDWVETSNAEFRFRFKTAKKPEYQAPPRGSTSSGSYKYDDYDVPEAMVISAQSFDRPDLKHLTDDQKLEKLFPQGEKISEVKTLKYQGFACRDSITFTNNGGIVIWRQILAKDRVITITAGGGKYKYDSPRLQALLNSVVIE